MPVSKIKREQIRISLPEATLRSVSTLAQREKKTVPKYIQSLIEHEVIKNGLPLYFFAENNSENKKD